MTDELKPCPFCGGDLTPWGAGHFQHSNSKCILAGRKFAKGYIGQWNRRAIPEPTHAAQLAAALALPEVAAMVDAQIAPLLTADLQAQLADPVAVHANMLRGTIAKPSIYQIMHIYGRDALMRAMDAEKMAALRKEFPNV